MGIVEVTNSQYELFSPGHKQMRGRNGFSAEDDEAVIFVNWFEAQAFCRWLSDKEGLHYRLPTEAEWEYAARGGLSRMRFPWGDTISHDRANYYSDGRYFYDISPTRGLHPDWNDGQFPYTAPVGAFAANNYGLYDIAGNVWEWCNDIYDPDYYDNSPSQNPTGPLDGNKYVLRGGAWAYDASFARLAYRGNYWPDYRYNYFGFRIALKPN